jgi:hypothetical protein
MGVEGVPLNQLHCPTCGLMFNDYNLYSDAEEFTVSQIISPIKAFAVGRKFLRCPDGHKWTVKTIWRSVHYPDHVQLGEYLGTV